MIRIITRVCMATAAVLLLAVPMEANYLRRVQMVATEGRLLSFGVEEYDEVQLFCCSQSGRVGCK